MMKNFALAAALTAAATTAFAGAPADPIIEAPVIVEEAPTSSFSPVGAIAGGLGALALIALIANSDDDTVAATTTN